MSTHTKCHRLAPGGALLTGILFLLPACGGEAESRDAAGDERLDGTTVEASALDGRAAEPPRTREPVPAIPTGTRMTLEMLETVSTSSHATGDVFTLRLVEDVQGVAGGRLAAGTRARGVVEKARRSTDSDEEALLLLRVTEVERGGAWTPVVARVESAAVQASAQDSGTRTAAKIATGTAVGAVVGQILGGDTRSTVTGAVVGTAAGVGVALTTRDGHASLPRGSRLVVALDQALVLD